MVASRKTLVRIVDALVDEWGVEEVRRAVDARADAPSKAMSGDEGVRPKVRRVFTAAELTASTSVPPKRRRVLSEVAGMFDQGAFLPQLSDVRSFLAVRGINAGALKSRPESFRRVLKVLLQYPDDALERIAANPDAGQSQLAPIADAIRSVGEERLKPKEDDDKDTSGSS